MRSDIRATYVDALEGSHHGYPSVVSISRSGRRGRPQIIFDADFLAWAYNRRSISALARFLGVGRTTLRNALVEHGIVSPSENSVHLSLPGTAGNLPNLHPPELSATTLDFGTEIDIPADDVLEPDIRLPPNLPQDIQDTATQLPTPSTLPVNHTHYHHSSITDQDLDNLIIRLRIHFRRAGIRMISGMLLRLGHRVQQARIRQSLLRIDPVRRVFERIRIREESTMLLDQMLFGITTANMVSLAMIPPHHMFLC